MVVRPLLFGGVQAVQDIHSFVDAVLKFQKESLYFVPSYQIGSIRWCTRYRAPFRGRLQRDAGIY